jgi:hypothetical protein
MKLQAGTLAVLCLLAGAAMAQETPGVVRQIAPERFQPNFLGDYRQGAAPSAVTPPSKEHPFGSCDRTSHSWLICLRATADLSNRMVSDVAAKVAAALDQRLDLNASLRRSSAKSLSDADSKWTALREEECGQLALLEFGIRRSLYEAQLICQITHNADRIDLLERRYGVEASGSTSETESPRN